MNVHQGLLVQQLKTIFPHDKPYENARKQSQIKYTHEGARYLELDVWFPKLNICFEFQDDYHYGTTWYHQLPNAQVQTKDNIKRVHIQKTGIYLVVIPCWWDGSVERLRSTIHYQCPHLLPAVKAPPIPLNPPYGFFRKTQLPSVGELMYVSFPTESNIIFQSNWWLGEKYDGIRCCWIPHQRKLYSRFGNELVLLPAFTSSIPRIFLDGELWFGRGSFSLAFMLISKLSVTWELLRMIAFDYPELSAQHEPFEVRYQKILSSPSLVESFMMVAPRLLWRKGAPLNSLVHLVIDDGGEGVILRQLESTYQHGRSTSLIKLKTAYGDKEGIVVGIRQHSIHLQLPNGIKFAVPLEDVHIKNLKLGDVVSFSYESHARRYTPVNAKIYRLRSDLSWDDVVNLYYLDQKYVGASSQLKGVIEDPIDHWTRKTMRLFLEEFAASKDLDPFVADTWHIIKDSELHQDSKGKIILNKFDGYANAVQCLFPEISFDPKFFDEPEWAAPEKRRQLFETYAEENNFDPLYPENWYLQSKKKLLSLKAMQEVIAYHAGKLSKTLVDLFPDVGLDKSQLWPSWRTPKRRRRFFENYAKARGFNPLIPENWYAQSKQDILSLRETRRVIFYHERRLANALVTLFPEIGLDKSKLWKSSWNDPKNRRRFFEKYARANHFDPLDPEKWYFVPKNHVMGVTGAKQVLSYHNGLSAALCDLFPEIGLIKSMFWPSWQDPRSRRKFFEDYAQSEGFDPLIPANWYHQSKDRILSAKGAKQVLYYHSGRLSQALTDLFPRIGLNPLKLAHSWVSQKNRRQFFENYANDHGFDPLNPNDWYMQSRKDILSEKGAIPVIGYHNNRLTTALLDLFPEIGLRKDKLWTSLWENELDRRKFFEDYAKANGFDPLKPANWYSQRKKIMAAKKASSVMAYHGGRVSTALLELFPEIGLDKSKL